MKMPILSNLSRRLHMLTTDAKPDPPRIPIDGYTHNLDSNAVNIEKEKTKSESVTTEPEQQVKANDKTLSEEKRSFENYAIPSKTANCSTAEQDPDDAATSANGAREQKRPNVKTKTKSRQQNSSRKAHAVNYNIINSNGVKIGSKTSYICNINQFAKNNTETPEEAWTRSKVRQMPMEVKHLCACTNEITLDDIFVVKTHIGHGWRDVARKLFYTNGQIEQFEENYRHRGISEVIYQLFLDWKQANTKDAEIGKLINILWTCKEYDCVERLVSTYSDTT
ncbi:death domain-containing immune deficiency protein isoform X3 [Xylocopa sonorina]|uniref:death domain-containing immune deficiency protein isoform X3 n=1 Tax=Xylocopa sonorina TaxID=1818115 RepID=UPI00403A9CCD